MLKDPPFTRAVSDAGPAAPLDADTAVLEWRRNGDILEGLVEIESDGETVREWLPALDMAPHDI
ncbi:hypothetical protein F0U44_17275 [Nocardioides humilatus]|uniref:Uncharacterized protein n=1 Tax=Nocardioides humilatus TaxID=2607660 RepID=A0A5B1L8M4_9ACTN|nr:hypothetical protein [Nocardioides humilatus]KAA1416935.1 hypothetical protein F0U44_17275 [Nocardioides humilatus]